MKKLVSMFLLLAAGCSEPGSTEINRPSPDVNGVRQLILATSLNFNSSDEFASASYSDGTTKGFGSGIFITCNSIPIIDTRKGGSKPDSGIFLPISADYNWIYQGADTSFEIQMNSPGELEITSIGIVPAQEFLFNKDSLKIVYQPSGPCSNLQLILTDNIPVDTIRPITPFDSTLGTIGSIWLGSCGLQHGVNGTLSIAKATRISFFSNATHSIIVEDSVMTKTNELVWK